MSNKRYTEKMRWFIISVLPLKVDKVYVVMINERCPKVIYKVHKFYLRCNDEIVRQLRYKNDNYRTGLRNTCE